MSAIKHKNELHPEEPCLLRPSRQACGLLGMKETRRLEGWAALLSICIVFFAAMPKPVVAQELEGDYLYKVSTIRAAPGKLEPLLNWAAALKEADYFKDAKEHAPFIMRHSQGDQWDLMLVTPMESWSAYHTSSRSRTRDRAAEKHIELLAHGDDLISFDEDHFAYGPPLAEFAREFAENGFFHIEMFEAAAGKAGELFEQRRMENTYLSATGGKPNMIFRRAAGSDVDVFTIGFHESLAAFAADSDATAEEREAAAKDAGFKDRADISFLLRSLITGHHDTLAVKVE